MMLSIGRRISTWNVARPDENMSLYMYYTILSHTWVEMPPSSSRHHTLGVTKPSSFIFCLTSSSEVQFVPSGLTFNVKLHCCKVVSSLSLCSSILPRTLFHLLCRILLILFRRNIYWNFWNLLDLHVLLIWCRERIFSWADGNDWNVFYRLRSPPFFCFQKSK